jgi:sortase A
MSRTRTKRTWRAIEILLLLTGFAALGIWGWSHVRMTVYQMWANRVLDHRAKAPFAAVAPGPASPPAAAPAPPGLPNGALIGRLEIPRLHLRSVVREGAGRDTLEVALGHIPGTSMPGQTGNTGIAGHRDTLFRGLRNIAKDDLIQFQTPAGNYDYRVESTGIVKPTDVAVLKAGHYPEMTLVTCYPFYYVGSAPDRFIVKARLVEPPTAAAATPPAPPAPVLKAGHTNPPVAVQHPPVVRPAMQRVGFQMNQNESRQVLPGVWLGLANADAVRQRASVWIFVTPQRQTIALKNQAAHQPVFFHGNDRQQRELMITRVTSGAVTGYLLLYGQSQARTRLVREP